MKNTLLVISGFFIATSTFSAELSSVIESDAKALNGFTELKHEDGFLKGIYSAGSEFVTVEVRRGKRTSSIMRSLNPDWPAYEMDVRILDSNDQPIYMQVGGHEPVNPSWSSSFDATNQARSVMNPEILGEKAEKSYQAAYRMLGDLQRVKFKANLAPEKRALNSAMNVLQTAMSVDTSLLEPKASVVRGCSDIQTIEVWKKGAFFPGNIFADHSGTVMKTTSGGKVYTVWVAANHGASPGDSSMTRSCYRDYYSRCAQSFAAPMCSTPLQWETKDFYNDDYKHVCNDDSYIQVQRIKTNASVSTSSGTCNDTTARKSAPACN